MNPSSLRVPGNGPVAARAAVERREVGGLLLHAEGLTLAGSQSIAQAARTKHDDDLRRSLRCPACRSVTPFVADLRPAGKHFERA
jgi:hypothetical protein